MNILHMKYAVEVARSGSINKAAEKLYIAQPNLSRCIKELETDLGISIFDRSSKGMRLTPKGKEFIQHARKILKQIDDLEKNYRETAPLLQSFSISVPAAGYISEAFTRFIHTIGHNPAEIYFIEANSSRAISNILNENYHLGIIRYAADHEENFRKILKEKGLSGDLLADFQFILLMSRKSPLAEKESVCFSDLTEMIEVSHKDPFVPPITTAAVKKEEPQDGIPRQIFLSGRGGQFELLSENPETFLWASPVPSGILERYDLVQKKCIDAARWYRDVLIYKKDYQLTETDQAFIRELNRSRKQWIP